LRRNWAGPLKKGRFQQNQKSTGKGIKKTNKHLRETGAGWGSGKKKAEPVRMGSFRPDLFCPRPSTTPERYKNLEMQQTMGWIRPNQQGSRKRSRTFPQGTLILIHPTYSKHTKGTHSFQRCGHSDQKETKKEKAEAKGRIRGLKAPGLKQYSQLQCSMKNTEWNLPTSATEV